MAPIFAPSPAVVRPGYGQNARTLRWCKLLETSVYGTIEEIAAAERINSSYVSRVLRLTLLASDILEAILNGGSRQSTRWRR